LPARDGADVDIVTEYGRIRRGHWERHLCKGRVKRFNSNDSVPLLRKAEGAQKAFHFKMWVGGPNTHVVTMLVCDTRPFDAEFHVYTVSGMSILE
jgi:hypothetical protein